MEAPLNGTYTVGSGGNYSTLTQAVGKLNSLGVSGAVTMTLTDASNGGEAFPIVINAFSGASSTNTVTIKPASGVSPTLSGTVAGGALIKLNGASFVIIDGSNNGSTSRNLTITNASTTAPTVISLVSLGAGLGATNNVIKNCNLSTGVAGTIGYGIAVGGSTPGTAGADNDNNTLQNNAITAAPIGIYANGTAAVTAGGDDNLAITGNSIDYNNTSTGLATIGIEVGNALTSSVSQNTVSEQTSTTQAPTGISLETGFVSSSVTRNTVTRALTTNTGGYGGRGMTIGTGTATSALQISNNVIYGVNGSDFSSFGNSSSMGIAIGMIGNSSTITTTAGGINLYFNSVNMTGPIGSDSTSAITTALYIGTGASALDLRDNVFANTMVGIATTQKNYAIYSAAANTAFTTINYNDYFVSNTFNAASAVLGFLGSDQTTIGAWRTATGQDLQSQSADPVFNSPTVLQPQAGSPVLDVGISLTGIVTPYVDFTGATRVDPPSMGAYELGGDGIGPVITYTALGNTTSTANRTLASTITDGTGVPTTGTGLPRIYYRKGVAGAFATTQAAFVSGSSYTFTIDYSLVTGGSVTSGDTIQYYVVAQDTVVPPNGSANPSTGAAGFSFSPPAVATPTTTPNSYSIVPAISGTKTVCASGCDYTTLTGATGAFNAINNGVLTSNLILQIAGDLTTGEDGSVALNALSESPSGSNFTLNIFPTGSARAITSTTAPTGGFIRLNGADRVTLNGSLGGAGTDRSLTITDANTGTTSAVVWLQTNVADGATNNIIKNLNVVGTSTTGTAGTLIGVGSGSSTVSISSTGTGNINNRFQNCNISKTSYGIYSGGASAANKNTGTVITQNVMNASSPNNLVIGGILVKFEDGVQITQNDIGNIIKSDGTTGTSGTAFAIALGAVPTNATTFTGSDVTNGVVTRNKIGVVLQLFSGGYSAFGIVVNQVTSGTTLVANNMISGVREASTSPDIGAAILAGGGAGSTTQIYGNSISMTGARGAASFPSYGLAIAGSNPTIDARDNVFFNTQTNSSTGKSYAIGLAYSTFTSLTSDFNNLFVSGTNTFIGQTGGLGTSGTDRSPLVGAGGWQATTSTDASSISAAPQFVSTTDLHLTVTAPEINVGATIAALTNDFDGDTRPLGAAYDIGADEFNNPPTITPVAVTRQQGSPVSNSTIANVTDVESGNGAVVVTVTSTNPSNGVTVSGISNTGGVVTANVVASCAATTATFTLQASDGSLTSTDTLTVTVTANTAPTLTYGTASVANTGSTTNNPATGPSDNGSVATIAVQSAGTYTGTISVDNVTGIVSISNAAPIGSHTITIRATDNCLAVTDATFTLNVTNNNPSITAGAPASRQQGSAGTTATIATVSDPDQSAGSLTVTATTVPSGISVTGITNTSGTVTATVAADCTATVGTNTVVLTVTDANSGTATANYTVNVTANTAPTLTYSTASLHVHNSTSVNPATGPSDNGSVSTIAVLSFGTYTGTISVNNVTGVVSISNATPSGSHTITIRATDNCGATTDASFTLNVINDSPVVTGINASRQQGTAASNSNIAIVTDTETASGSIVVTVTSGNPSNGVTISNIVNTGGTISADIVASCTASTASFTLSASDGDGGTGLGSTTVTVTANTAPTLTYNTPPTLAFGGSTTVNPATGPTDNGTISTIVVLAGHGLTTAPTVDSGGVVSITNAQPAGPHTITIRATDNCGAVTDAPFTLTVAAAIETTVVLSGGNLTITDANGGNTADTLTISRSGANVLITDPSQTVGAGAGTTQVDANTVSVPFANITGNITVNTLDGNDTLTLALAGGNIFPPGGIFYNGGAQTSTPGDKLIITGGNQGIVNYNYTNAHDGSIFMLAFGTVTYTGLEPITNSGTASDVVFNLPVGTPNAATLADDGTAANGMSRLSGANFETTDFSNPTNSVQISRGNATDTLTTTALPDLTSNLFIGAPGSEFTTVSFAGAMTLASNHSLMAYSSGGMGLTGAAVLATSGTGQISLTTASGLTLAGGGLTTVNGPITLNANQQGVATTGAFTGVSLSGATVEATGTGVVTVNGRGGNGAGVSNPGIALSSGAIIRGGTTSGATTTSVVGTGGAGGINLHGLQAGGTISSNGGNVQVTGNAGAASGASSHGIILFAGGQILSGGSGSVTVIGTGGSNTGGNNIGVLADDVPSKITAAGSGVVLVTGTGGGGTSNGVSLTRGGAINSSGGPIIVTGTGSGIGINLDGTGSSNTSTVSSSLNAAVTLVGDTMTLDGANTSISAGTGTVTLRQLSNGRIINLGGNDTGQLGLTDSEMDRVTAGTLVIGDANSGNINVSTLITQTGHLTNIFTGTLTTVLNTGALGISGTINSPLNVNGELRPGTSLPGIINNIGNVAFASGSTFAVEIGGTTPGNGAGNHDQLNVTGTVSLGNATLTLAAFGTYTPTAGDTLVIVNNDGSDPISGTFNERRRAGRPLPSLPF